MTAGAVPVSDGRAEDAERLSDLALRSKGHWGYDAAFLEACRAELTLTPERAAAARVVRDGDALLGFHLLDAHLDQGELLMLFVEPSAIGRGVGRALLDDARAGAAARGWSAVRIESDPGAEAFYLAHGARRVGTVPSGSVAGREIPLLELPVPVSGSPRSIGAERGVPATFGAKRRALWGELLGVTQSSEPMSAAARAAPSVSTGL